MNRMGICYKNRADPSQPDRRRSACIQFKSQHHRHHIPHHPRLSARENVGQRCCDGTALTACRIFWFLLILSAAFFVPFALFLPETCRKLVGDGSIPPPWTSANISDSIRFKNRAKKGISVDEEKLAELRKNYKISFPNPMTTLVVFKDLETSLLLVSSGMMIACVSTATVWTVRARNTRRLTLLTVLCDLDRCKSRL